MSLNREELENALANLIILNQQINLENEILRFELNEYEIKEIDAAWDGMNATVPEREKVISMMEDHLEFKDI
jgi:hypothetical protein